MESGVTDNIGINQLPSEILTQVFLRLPVSERNNARLVCKQWFDVCNGPFIHKNEKFIFSGIHSIEEIIPVLLRSNRQYLNLEFHNIQFSESTISFWEQCGPKILELQFVDCDLSDKIVEIIIRHCCKLFHLAWKCENCFAEATLWSENVLSTLLKQNIVRENLISLEINLCRRRSLSNYLLSGIFDLFPKIRRFSFFYPLDRGFNSMTVDKDGKRQDVFTFSSIFNKLNASASETETLKLGSPLCAGFDWKAIALISQLTELQEIEINDDILRVPENVITTFVSRQKYLKSMKCTIRYTHARHFIGKLLRCLLTDCVHLQHLQLIYNGLVNVCQDLLQQFAKSKLKSFSMRCGDMNMVIPEKLPVNYTMRSFTIGSYSLESYRILSYSREEEIRLALLQIFKNLRYLEMNLVTDAILQGVWKYQSSIKGLKLNISGGCSDFGFTGRLKNREDDTDVYSLKNMRKLQYLELRSHDNLLHMSGDIFDGLNLPDLKYLRILFAGNRDYYKPLIPALQCTSILEGLCITTEEGGIPYFTLAELVSQLKRLRYLSILGGPLERCFTEEKYENLFQLCPSLRFLVHRTASTCEKYYYDFLRRRVVKKSTLKRFMIPTEHLETNYVCWFAF